LQQEKTYGAVGEVPVQHQHVGLGGYVTVSHAATEEDTEMPDITHEKFPYGTELTGMLMFQHINCRMIFCTMHHVH